MNMLNERHPEIKPGEMFISNASIDSFNKIIFKTKRLGLIAYDRYGNNMDSKIFFPVFASVKEVEKEMKNQNCTDFNRFDFFEEVEESTSRLM